VTAAEGSAGGPEFAAPAAAGSQVATPPSATPDRAAQHQPQPDSAQQTTSGSKISFRERLGFAKKADVKAPESTSTWSSDQPKGPPANPEQTEQNTVAQTDRGATAPPIDAPAKPGSEAATDTAIIPVVAGPPPGAVTTGAQVKPSAGQSVTGSRAKPGAARRTRKARLRLSRLDPWSVMKTSFLFSIAGGIMLVVAVYVVWTVIGASSLFDSVNDIVKSVVSTPGDTTPFRIQEYINTQKVMGVAALLACVDVVIFTALATLGSFLYNLAATMLGGLEITLAED
jgi:hypothetical protein